MTWYGNLKLSNPIHLHLHPNSNKKLDWDCKCGGKVTCIVHNVTAGRTVRCKKCSKQKIQRPSEDMLKELDILLEDASHQMAQELRYRHISFFDIQEEIINFIKLFDPCVESQYEIDGIVYSIFVPSANLIIEYQHLDTQYLYNTQRRDHFDKYQHVAQCGYDYLLIYEDEWMDNQHKVKNLISNRILRSKPKSLRPKQCWLEHIKGKDTVDFYNKYHYIGACRAKVHIGVFYDYELVGCVSFGHPTRQTIKYRWELLRMVSHPEYRVHGIWSKLIKQFAIDNDTTSIISFSDNRLFQGGVYEKMGFKYDGNVAPDYYWVKNNKRFHKSGLRKTVEERKTGLTEVQLREAQGYRKTWDLGKKRWVYNNEN